LSGSGKSTICNSLEVLLNSKKVKTFTLDGDSVRNGLNKDLSFSDEDRSENIRRVAEVSKILMNAGNVVLASFISPFQKDRELVKQIVGQNNYLEVSSILYLTLLFFVMVVSIFIYFGCIYFRYVCVIENKMF
jgi:adenylylsulfate kinase